MKKIYTDKFDLTIFIPTYNQESCIKRSIDSVLSQKTDYKFKICVLDDYSTDKTPIIVQEIQHQHPDKIEFIRQKDSNHGPFNLVYLCLCNKLNTEFWSILDGDDYWCDEDKIQYSLDILKEHKNCVGFAHQVIFMKENGIHFFNSFEQTKIITKNKKIINFKKTGIVLPHSSSRIYRNIINFVSLPEKFVFDTALFTLFLSKGDIYYSEKLMSVYDSQKSSYWYKNLSVKRNFINFEGARLLQKEKIILAKVSRFLNWTYDDKISKYFPYKKVVKRNFKKAWLKYIYGKVYFQERNKLITIYIRKKRFSRYYILILFGYIFTRYRFEIKQFSINESRLNEGFQHRISTKRTFQTTLLNRIANFLQIQKVFSHIK